MAGTDYLTQSPKRIGALGLTAAVHIALFLGWQMSRQAPPQGPEQARMAIQWMMLPPPPPPEPLRPRQTHQAAPATTPASMKPIATAAPEEERAPAPVLPAMPAPEAPRLIDRLDQAKGELGKIDAEIRKERRGLISAPADSPELRMRRKMAQAADMVPNRWYQAPKVTEIVDPGGYGRRRYKVVGAAGTYCITQESNHGPDGQDTMRNGIRPKVTTCPRDEQAATKQDW